MRRLLFILVLPIIIATAAATDVSGPVSGTWTTAGSPYNVVGEITLPVNQTLVIQPGVQLIFQGHYKFLVYGCLQAVGTPQDSILFTAANTSTGFFGLRFYDLNSQADSSRLVYCHISYGVSSSDTGTNVDKNGGAIYASNSDKLLISHCLIDHNRTGDVWGADGQNGGLYDPTPGQIGVSGSGGAIYLIDSNSAITFNTFRENHTGSAHGGNGGIGRGHFYIGIVTAGDGALGGNAASGEGGALYSMNGFPFLCANAFRNNFTGVATGGNGGAGGNANSSGSGGQAFGGDGGLGGAGQAGYGGAVASEGALASANNNLFSGNYTGEGHGGGGGAGGSGTSQNGWGYGGNGGDGGNGLGGNGSGIGYNQNGSLEFLTFTLNRTGVAFAGPGGPGGYGTTYSGGSGDPGSATPGQHVIFTSGSSMQLTHSILWSDPLQTLPVGMTVNYSEVQGGYPGTGNLNTDPVFVRGPGGAYYLSQIAAGQTVQSPCVDAGSPSAPMIIGTTRTDEVQDSGIVDMGFHYYDSLYIYVGQPFLSVEPSRLTFIAAVNDTNPAPQTLLIQNIGPDSLYYQIDETIPWLSVSQSSGGPVTLAHPDTVIVSIDITALGVGTYTGTIRVTSPGAIGNPDSTVVQLTISDRVLAVNPDTLYFFSQYGIVNPPPQTFTISNTGLGTFNYTITDSIPWLSVAPMSGGPVPPARTESVSVDLTGLPQGTYIDTIWINAPEAAGSPHAIRVKLDHYRWLSGPVSGYLLPANYYVNGIISVMPDTTLTIAPGVHMYFPAGSGFMVSGSLQAMGNESDSIVFTDDSTNSGWDGILFYQSGADASQLKFCRISGSNSSGIRCDYSSPLIANCLIAGNSGTLSAGGVDLSMSSAHLSGCVIQNNSSSMAGGLYCTGTASEPLIEDCIIQNNIGLTGTGTDVGGLGCGTANAIIRNCIIRDNTATLVGGKGGVMFSNGSYNHPQMEGCLITGNLSNTDYAGIFIGYSSYPSITNCTITDNLGTGIFIWQAGMTFDNNVVCGNAGAGISLAYVYQPTSIQFSDFSGNLNGNFIGYLLQGLGILSQINANGDSCDVYHNLLLDPLFLAPDSGDFHLTAASPCIDAGDPASPFDPDSTVADMGAFYFDQTQGVSPGKEIVLPTCFALDPPHPNPFNPTAVIRYQMPSTGQVRLMVYDTTGRLVCMLVEGWRMAGVHEVTFDGSGLSSGLYFVRMQAGSYMAVQKMVLMK